MIFFCYNLQETISLFVAEMTSSSPQNRPNYLSPCDHLPFIIKRITSQHSTTGYMTIQDLMLVFNYFPFMFYPVKQTLTFQKQDKHTLSSLSTCCYIMLPKPIENFI